MRKGIWGFALVAIVLLMASCSSESEYANAIPKDAAMVMSFDFKTMAEKSGINGKGGEKGCGQTDGRIEKRFGG